MSNVADVLMCALRGPLGRILRILPWLEASQVEGEAVWAEVEDLVVGEVVAVPWVDKGLCAGCGICVSACPGGAISMSEGVAVIGLETCIRCGECHEFCPKDAIRHDSELTDSEIEKRVKRVKDSMDACIKIKGDEMDGQRCLERYKNHYKREISIIEEVLARIEKFKKN